MEIPEMTFSNQERLDNEHPILQATNPLWNPLQRKEKGKERRRGKEIILRKKKIS